MTAKASRLVNAVYPKGSYGTCESRMSTERPPGHKALQGFDLVACVTCSLLLPSLTVYRLIAIMLGRLAMDAEECTSEYSKFMEFVFGERSSWLPIGWTGQTKAQFDSMRVKNTIEEFIPRKRVSRIDLLTDGSLQSVYWNIDQCGLI